MGKKKSKGATGAGKIIQIAESFKEQGNKEFLVKQWEAAIQSYTRAIDILSS
jgi:hypothetical protein